MPAIRDWLRRRGDVLALGLLFLGLYLATLYPGPGGRLNYGDSAKLGLLPAVDGTPHGSGYPLYLLLSKLAYWAFPSLEIWDRVALLSAVFGTLTVLGVYLLGRQLTGRRFAGLPGALLLGSSYLFWTQSTEAEVYTLHTFFVVLVTGLFLQFHATRRRRWLYAGAAAVALGFGNHLMMVTLLPALLVLTLQTDRTLVTSWRVWLALAGIAALGVLPYGYLLYLSHYSGSPYLEYLGRDASLGRLWDYVRGAQFADRFEPTPLGDALVLLGNGSAELAASLGRSLTVLGAGAGLYGLFRGATGLAAGEAAAEARVVAPVDRRAAVLFLTVALATHGLFAAFYNIEHGLYFLPIHVLLCVPLCYGLAAPRPQALAFGALVGLVVLFNGVFNLRYTDVSRVENQRFQRLRALLARVPRGSTIYLPEGRLYPMRTLITLCQHTGTLDAQRFHIVTTRRGLCARPRLYTDAAGVKAVRACGRDVRCLSGCDDLGAFLTAHRQHTVLLASAGLSRRHLTPTTRRALDAAGARLGSARRGDRYLAVIAGGRVRLERLGPLTQAWTAPATAPWRRWTGGRRLQLNAGGYRFCDREPRRVDRHGLCQRTSIRVGGRELSRDRPGLNAVVLGSAGQVLARRSFALGRRDLASDAIFEASGPPPGEPAR